MSKNVFNNFPESNSQKNIIFFIINNKEKPFLTFEKLETANLWHFCLKNVMINKLPKTQLIV